VPGYGTGRENEAVSEATGPNCVHLGIENPHKVGAIGYPDERLGEIVAIVIEVVPGKTLTTEEVLAFCDDMPRYRRPRKVFFGDIPRNPTGKIEKVKLRKRYI
jgi:acyl-CoA synthetase (AMP-forming)/AMP-acid ligase II